MTEAIYLEVSEKTEAAKKAGRRVSVSGMLKFLGVSRSGYLAWLHHVPCLSVESFVLSQLSLTRITHQVSHAFDLNYLGQKATGTLTSTPSRYPADIQEWIVFHYEPPVS